MSTVLVTGGGGFLGRSICEQLLARGDAVRSFARSAYPSLAEQGVDVRRGDLGNREEVCDAVHGCDAVIHVASKVGVWGARPAFFQANVIGTRNLIEGCRAQRIRTLVYTSTPSVVHDGHDLEGVDESVPYAKHFDAAYPETKAIAEQEVLAANNEQLRTVALRPHLIWGPGDTQLLPRLAARASAGKLRIIGSGEQKIDTTYIDDAARAHLLALDALAGDGACAGKAYFISQGEPWPMKQMVNGLLVAGGVAPVERHISARLAVVAGAIAEGSYKLLSRKEEPPITRFTARQAATAHWYDISAARRDLGYAPSVTIEEGLARLAESLRRRDDRLGEQEVANAFRSDSSFEPRDAETRDAVPQQGKMPHVRSK